MRSDQTVGESANAVLPVKQSLLDGRFILEGQLSGLEQRSKHAEHGIPFKPVTASKNPFRFDQDKQRYEHRFFAAQRLLDQFAGASSLLDVVGNEQSHNDVRIESEHDLVFNDSFVLSKLACHRVV
jgi:hypothetical protein